MSDLLDDSVIAERLAALQQPRETLYPVAPAQPTRYRYVTDLGESAASLIDFLQNPLGRWMFGVREIDAMVRGVGRGELMFITGRAHSGKTQILLQSICNNPNARVLYFTPDEVSDLVLMKLISMTRGINGEALEQRIRDNDRETIETVLRVAKHDFANLIVIDQRLTFDAMSVALQEAEDMWGATADLVAVDYLELLPGDNEYTGVTSKATGLKGWTKNHSVPMVCIHQASKSGAARGAIVDMDSMRFGGDDAATFVLGVYRKGDDKTLDDTERAAHSNTVTVNVAKNKRPPSRKGEVDLLMDPDTGAVRSLPVGGVWVPGMRASGPLQIIQQQKKDATDG